MQKQCSILHCILLISFVSYSDIACECSVFLASLRVRISKFQKLAWRVLTDDLASWSLVNYSQEYHVLRMFRNRSTSMMAPWIVSRVYDCSISKHSMLSLVVKRCQLKVAKSAIPHYQHLWSPSTSLQIYHRRSTFDLWYFPFLLHLVESSRISILNNIWRERSDGAWPILRETRPCLPNHLTSQERNVHESKSYIQRG